VQETSFSLLPETDVCFSSALTVKKIKADSDNKIIFLFIVYYDTSNNKNKHFKYKKNIKKPEINI
jgi:hypothetical protein